MHFKIYKKNLLLNGMLLVMVKKNKIETAENLVCYVFSVNNSSKKTFTQQRMLFLYYAVGWVFMQTLLCIETYEIHFRDLKMSLLTNVN